MNSWPSSAASSAAAARVTVRDAGSLSRRGNSLEPPSARSKRTAVKPTAIVKRDGTEVPFDLARISGAITKKIGLKVESTKNAAGERCYKIAE